MQPVSEANVLYRIVPGEVFHGCVCLIFNKVQHFFILHSKGLRVKEILHMVKHQKSTTDTKNERVGGMDTLLKGWDWGRPAMGHELYIIGKRYIFRLPMGHELYIIGKGTFFVLIWVMSSRYIIKGSHHSSL